MPRNGKNRCFRHFVAFPVPRNRFLSGYMPFRGVGTNLRIIDLNGHACRWVAGKDVIEDVVCDEVAELVGVADTHRFSASHYRHARAPFTKANNKKARPVSGRQETKRAG